MCISLELENGTAEQELVSAGSASNLSREDALR